jgi:hypothetical protein
MICVMSPMSSIAYSLEKESLSTQATMRHGVKETKHGAHVIIPTGCILSSDSECSEGAFPNSIVPLLKPFRPSFRHLDIRRYLYPSGQLVAIGSFEFI